MIRARAISAIGGALALLLVLWPGTATAHENRDIADNRFAVTIGFINEPAFVGRENGLFLRIVEYGAGGVEGLDQTLQAEVLIGPDSMPLELLPDLDAPGTYESRFTPTRVGDYTFRIYGQIGDAAVDEQFTSSPQGFDPVQPASADQFPVAVPAGEELTQRLDALQGGVDEDDLDGVRTIAYVGVAIGLVGLLTAVAAVFWARRQATGVPVRSSDAQTSSEPDEDYDDTRLVR